ncbi:sensor histidine kinase [Noviherbaspirillum sedimenti]|uniref:histidine kinase n=1 Tax=Noviherbaspirillum sedimenti TaxID=2320865 RepID=A0A3A3G1H8_9BURK|nr:ATP-binding protein [Noviherbaspirillum sedimenti]RJG01495.1 two-component sensor histidine kinase [Noviherbaspirillum sedimenti]
MNSIRNTLLVWLLVGVSTAIGLAAAVVYDRARQEANELSDKQMKQMVASLPQPPGPVATTRTNQNSQRDDFVVQVWDSANGFRLYNSHGIVNLPQPMIPGFHDQYVEKTEWRIYNARLGETIVQVAQLASARHELAASVALRTVAPLILLLPFLAVLIWVTVGRSLDAVKIVAAQVQSREANALNDIPDYELPREIQPLTHAFNALLSRLRRAAAAQSAFIADAAHEFKTPLTALKLQVQLAERADTDEECRQAFADLKGGLERTSHLVHQLLTHARQDPAVPRRVSDRIDLVALVHCVAVYFAPIAVDRGIDLGVKAADPTSAHVHGNPESLRIMLNNLVDNAVRYTPAGGLVDISVQAYPGGFAVVVEDTGPGIPDEELLRVMDRFYRVPGTPSEGSGLGLAIVRQIANAHGAEIRLRNGTSGKRGLHAEVIFRAEI